MKQFIKDLILGYRIKRAIRLAEELSRVSKRRYLVLMVAGIPKVYSKQELKKMIPKGNSVRVQPSRIWKRKQSL